MGFNKLDNLINIFNEYRVVRNNNVISAAVTAEKHEEHTIHTEFSFMQALMLGTNPMVSLMSSEQQDKQLQSFIDKFTNLINVHRAKLINDKYTESYIQEDVHTVLRDPVRALSDKGLSNAAISFMAKQLSTAVFVVNQDEDIKLFPHNGIPSNFKAIAIQYINNQYKCTINTATSIDHARNQVIERMSHTSSAYKIAEGLQMITSKRLTSTKTLEALQDMANKTGVPIVDQNNKKRTKLDIAENLISIRV